MSSNVNNVLHYPGDLTETFDFDAVYGPDLYGGHYRAESATYDAERDLTTVIFRPVMLGAAR